MLQQIIPERLAKTSQKIVARRYRSDLARWSAINDPQQYSWQYETKLKVFRVSLQFLP
jgi:hypothetical protein